MPLFLGFVTVLCLFIYIYYFSCDCGSVLPMFNASLIYIFCACVLVLPMFYASLFIFSSFLCLWLGFAYVLCLFICILFLFFCANVSWFLQCYMTFYIYFIFSFISVVGFGNILCLYIIFFSFLLCLCFANVLCLFIYTFLVFCVCGSILPMLFASSFIFFFFFSACALVLPMFYASLFEFLSFLLCLCLGFANVLCHFIYIFLFFCVSGLVFPNVL